MNKTQDFTKGVIWKQLLFFFFPILIGSFFQQLYNTVDTIIVGQACGTNALAAVGSTGNLTNLVVNFYVGLSTGASVVIAQYYGAHNKDKIHQAVHTSYMLAIVSGIIMMLFGLFFSYQCLDAIGVPHDILNDASLYMRLYFLGMIPGAIYNIGSGILRAVGDSKRPLYYLIICSIVNVVFDFVLVVILAFKHGTKGMLSNSAVLIGIICGYVLCMILPLFISTTGVASDGTEFVKSWVLNWDKVAQAKWFALPKLMPVKPVFDLRAILPVLIMFVVTAVETVGDISGVMEGGMSREATDQELSGGVICDGIGSSIAALFGVLPNTSFSQNVGLVTMTKIVNRFALACGAIFLIICGLFPKLAALVSIMPQSVLGGAAVIMFSSIVMSGVQLITKEPLTARSMTIVSVALGLGYGIGANSAILAQLPQAIQMICGESGIVPAAFVAIILNILLPKEKQ